jgi:hypothetical protein
MLWWGGVMFDNMFRRLFGRETLERETNQSPFAIPIPEGTDPKMWERTRPPIHNRKKHTPDEIEADAARYKNEMHEKFRYIGAFDRNRAQSAGAKAFIWRTARDAAVCPECRKMEGKRFSYQKSPQIGFPGDHICPVGWCRCWSEAIFPK